MVAALVVQDLWQPHGAVQEKHQIGVVYKQVRVGHGDQHDHEDQEEVEDRLSVLLRLSWLFGGLHVEEQNQHRATGDARIEEAGQERTRYVEEVIEQVDQHH